ncbi:MAG: peroxiredoxin [Candidatus Paceibacterota bacterium]|jgi:peroxiredoxin Q/BCP
MLKIGTKAPDFTLRDKDGNEHSLSQYKGLPVLVYFYPKDETPGCVKEALSIKKEWDNYLDHGVMVLGISPDSEENHQKFSDNHSIPFPLLSDSNKKTISEYDALDAVGKTQRISYLINPNGEIVRVYSNIKPEEHGTQVLQDVHTLHL